MLLVLQRRRGGYATLTICRPSPVLVHRVPQRKLRHDTRHGFVMRRRGRGKGDGGRLGRVGGVHDGADAMLPVVVVEVRVGLDELKTVHSRSGKRAVCNCCSSRDASLIPAMGAAIEIPLLPRQLFVPWQPCFLFATHYELLTALLCFLALSSYLLRAAWPHRQYQFLPVHLLPCSSLRIPCRISRCRSRARSLTKGCLCKNCWPATPG